MDAYRTRRLVSVIVLAIAILVFVASSVINQPAQDSSRQQQTNNAVSALATQTLDKLQIKGRSPKTGYSREQFGAGWTTKNNCDTRNIILNRDLREVKLNSNCQVTSGVLDDPYTGTAIQFTRSASSSGKVQIDHVVALSDAWQKGAQFWVKTLRITFANDPIELLAVDGEQNQKKGDGDAATWLPPNKTFRCEYVARQIAVKFKYNLWVTSAEHDAMKNILNSCPSQLLPSP
jgi:hypothetical protein